MPHYWRTPLGQQVNSNRPIKERVPYATAWPPPQSSPPNGDRFRGQAVGPQATAWFGTAWPPHIFCNKLSVPRRPSSGTLSLLFRREDRVPLLGRQSQSSLTQGDRFRGQAVGAPTNRVVRHCLA